MKEYPKWGAPSTDFCIIFENDELEKWHTDRNAKQKGVNWQFTTDDARIKLKHLYPIVIF